MSNTDKPVERNIIELVHKRLIIGSKYDNMNDRHKQTNTERNNILIFFFSDNEDFNKHPVRTPLNTVAVKFNVLYIQLI